MSILLARWLAPQDFGAFSVAFSVFLLVAAVHTSVLTEPMIIFGAGEFAGNLRSYVGFLLSIHAVLTILLSLLILLVSTLFLSPSGPLASTLASLALASPFMLLPWLSRRVFYARFAPRAAASGSAVFLVLSVAGVFFLSVAGTLSASSALIACGVAGLAATSPLFILLRPVLRDRGLDRRAVLARHWSFGSRNTLASGVYWLSAQLPHLVAPAVLGLSVTGAIAAAVNLFRPLSLLMQSSTAIVLPAFSRTANEDSAASLRQMAVRVIVFFVSVSFVYGVSTAVFSRPILRTVYGGQYDDLGSLVVLVALASTASAFTQAITTLLKATGQLSSIVSIWLLSAIVVAASIVPAMLLWGANGAIGATVVGYLVASVAAWRVLAREFDHLGNSRGTSGRAPGALEQAKRSEQ